MPGEMYLENTSKDVQKSTNPFSMSRNEGSDGICPWELDCKQSLKQLAINNDVDNSWKCNKGTGEA